VQSAGKAWLIAIFLFYFVADSGVIFKFKSYVWYDS